jgi:hypothetical protein
MLQLLAHLATGHVNFYKYKGIILLSIVSSKLWNKSVVQYVAKSIGTCKKNPI